MSRRAFTLIELLIAMTLATIVVGTAAFAMSQTQASAAVARRRLDTARRARAVLDELQDDLAHVIPCARLPRAHGGGPPLVLAEDRVAPTAGLERSAGRVRAFVARARDGREERGVVEWGLDTWGSAQTVVLDRPHDGGLPVARLRRRVLSWSSGTPGDTAAMHDVLSFRIEYLPAAGESWLPGPSSRDGAAFVVSEAVRIIDPFCLGGRDTLARALPLGANVELELAPAGQVLERRVRRREPTTSGGGSALHLDERLPSSTGEATLRAFLPPGAIRATILVAFGRGPDAGTARFTRVMEVR